MAILRIRALLGSSLRSLLCKNIDLDKGWRCIVFACLHVWNWINFNSMKIGYNEYFIMTCISLGGGIKHIRLSTSSASGWYQYPFFSFPSSLLSWKKVVCQFSFFCFNTPAGRCLRLGHWGIGVVWVRMAFKRDLCCVLSFPILFSECIQHRGFFFFERRSGFILQGWASQGARIFCPLFSCFGLDWIRHWQLLAVGCADSWGGLDQLWLGLVDSMLLGLWNGELWGSLLEGWDTGSRLSLRWEGRWWVRGIDERWW